MQNAKQLCFDGCQVIFLDIETASLSRDAEILQIGAWCGQKSWTKYILPSKAVSPSASAINKLTFFDGKLFFNGQLVNAVPTQVALKEFSEFVRKCGTKVILAAHNGTTFDFRRLHWQMETAKLKLPENVVSFLDTMKLFKIVRPGLKSYKLTDLAANEVFNAHDASEDSKVLQKLVVNMLEQFDPDMISISNCIMLRELAWTSNVGSLPAKNRRSNRPRKRQVSVDQYTAHPTHALLSDIPAVVPLNGSGAENVPEQLPKGTRVAKEGLGFHCDVCRCRAPSYNNLLAHLKGRRHLLHVLMGAISSLSDDLKKDKFGIEITIIDGATVTDKDDIQADIEWLPQRDSQQPKSRHVITFKMANVGQQPVMLQQCQLLNPYGMKVEAKVGTIIMPGDHVIVPLKVTRESVGVYSTLLVLMFTNDNRSQTAHVVRKISAHVHDPDVSDLHAKEPYKKPPKTSVEKTVVEVVEGLPPFSELNDGNDLERVVRLKEYMVPAALRAAINHGLELPTDPMKLKPAVVASIHLYKRILEQRLNAESHRALFDTLIHVEEIQMEVDIRKYDLSDAVMGVCKEDKRLLTLEVPGLVENRPSVLKGDHLFVRLVKEADGKLEQTEYKGYVHNVAEKQVHLGFSDKLKNKWLPNMKFGCRFVFGRLPLKLQHRAVELADENSLGDFLFPTDDYCAKYPPISVPDRIVFYDAKIGQNDRQALAVRQILAGSSRPAPFLVFGPPGTGKTVTIVEAMKQVLKMNPSAHILACAPSNSAANLIAERLLDHLAVKSSLYRLYAASLDPRSIPDKLKAYCNYNGRHYVFPKKDVLAEKSVIVCTLVTAGRLVSANFQSKHFTHIFIDEAGQATEPETLIAIAGIFEPDIRVKNGGVVVLAGDPEQLGPVLRSPVAIRCGLGKSLLERLMKSVDVYKRKTAPPADQPQQQQQQQLYDDRLVVKLVRNYRSHPEILRIPNGLFYSNELEAHADQLARESLCRWERLQKPGFPIIFHGVVGKDERESRSPSFFNVDEISVILDYVSGLLSDRKSINVVQQKEIGIISPYRRQVQKIRQALNKKKISEITVGSVEEFQGQERRVIIISTVRSSVAHVPMDYDYKLGFLSNPKRFNVAITRAKALLIVVGNPHLLFRDANWKVFLEFCCRNGAYRGCEFDFAAKDREEDIDQLAGRLSEMQLNEITLQVSDVTEEIEPEWRRRDD